MWTVGGLYALAGGGACRPGGHHSEVRGFYVYARRALGEAPGSSSGCADWFSNTAFIAYGASPSASTSASWRGRLASIQRVASTPSSVSALQLFGMRVSSRVQEVTSFLKAIALPGLVAVLLRGGSSARPHCRWRSRRSVSLVSLVLALQLVIGAYDGWQSAMYFAGEDRHPARNLPRAFIGGVAIVIVVYLLMNLAADAGAARRRAAGVELPAADAAGWSSGRAARPLITALARLAAAAISSVLLCLDADSLRDGRDDAAARAAWPSWTGGTPVAALLCRPPPRSPSCTSARSTRSRPSRRSSPFSYLAPSCRCWCCGGANRSCRGRSGHGAFPWTTCRGRRRRPRRSSRRRASPAPWRGRDRDRRARRGLCCPPHCASPRSSDTTPSLIDDDPFRRRPRRRRHGRPDCRALRQRRRSRAAARRHAPTPPRRGCKRARDAQARSVLHARHAGS